SPAVGFAIDVEAAAGALEAGSDQTADGADAPVELSDGAGGVLVCGPLVAANEAAEELRRRGKRAVAELSGLEGEALAAYARRWGFTEVVRAGSRAADSRATARRSNNNRKQRS
ncbi:MAG TPA: hypothetical protein VHK47_18400, partial [Polyangia bacterium]|nr:hypothetical protein [Polyangia bacterium]